MLILILQPWIAEILNIFFTLPWSIIEENILGFFNLNLDSTLNNIFWRRIIHLLYSFLSIFINLFTIGFILKLINKVKIK
ncbi:hypothetical protein D0T92_01435 [Neisseria zalophi]|uniref:Uncharacterized protein n=1 Tax=Neisseria zalophi TaxID=640030 RepID=A0A5J6Q2B4_9NEIS|nr:hypothetical protein D0T92_01435 [Neisseria zalophi]